MKRRSFLLLMLLCWIVLTALPHTSTAQHSLPDPLPEDFNSWIETEMDRWEIPGLAIAIVHEDSVIYSQGFGVRKLGEEALVDEETLFGIASVSKNMTAASLGLLVDEGLIGWDDRVVDHLPRFRLSDPWVTKHVTIRDLLTHQVGVGRIMGNRLQFMTKADREELIYRLRYHDFEEPFRSSYVYSNIMYMTAGEIVAAVTGIPWDQFMEQRLFEPIGMNRTNTSIQRIGDQENAAWPHQSIRDSLQVIPRRNWDNAAAAGGVNATVLDVARWLRLQLGDAGVFDGERILSRPVMRDIHSPQVALPISDPYSSQVSYGFGWRIYDYEGYRVLSHGGATDGMNTQAAFLPELDLGIVVVSNVFSWFPDAILITLFDSWTGQPQRDWSRLYYNNFNHRYAEATERRDQIWQSRKEETAPTLDLADYAGSYYNDLYGRAEIRQVSNGLQLRLWRDDDMVGDLEHWHHDTWRAVWQNPALREEFLHFTLNQEGGIGTLDIEFVLRPLLLQVGAYPSDYTRTVSFGKVEP